MFVLSSSAALAFFLSDAHPPNPLSGSESRRRMTSRRLISATCSNARKQPLQSTPLMHRLAFSTNAFKKNSLDEAIDFIGGIGYAGVELMADLHHAYPPTMDGPRRDHTKQLLASRKLPVSNVNAFTLFACGDTYHPTWIEKDPAQRKLRVDHTLACIDLASEFGAKT